MYTIDMNMITEQKYIDRFWTKVVVTSNNEDCWLWDQGQSTYDAGYGQYNAKVLGVRSPMKASRFALIVATNKNPKDLFACHTCDNPPCCNPNHLYWGTPQQNLLDRYERNPVEKCVRGHDLDKKSSRQRSCSICNLLRSVRHQIKTNSRPVSSKQLEQLKNAGYTLDNLS